MIEAARRLVVNDCEGKIRSACDGDNLVDLLTAMCWSEHIEGVDRKLLEDAQTLVATKCTEVMANLEDELQAAMTGIDVGQLQHAINAIRSLTMLPTDPTCGWGERQAVTSKMLEQSICKAKDRTEAIPKSWLRSQDGKPRIDPAVLSETRDNMSRMIDPA